MRHVFDHKVLALYKVRFLIAFIFGGISARLIDPDHYYAAISPYFPPRLAAFVYGFSTCMGIFFAGDVAFKSGNASKNTRRMKFGFAVAFFLLAWFWINFYN